MKQLQASLPLDVQSFLARAEQVPDEILSDPRYTLRVAFVPVIPSSGRSPDVVAYFVRPEDAGDLPEGLRDALRDAQDRGATKTATKRQACCRSGECRDPVRIQRSPSHVGVASAEGQTEDQ